MPANLTSGTEDRVTGCKGGLTRKELEFSSYQDSSLTRTAQQHPVLDIKSSLESSTRLSLATALPEGTTVSKVTLRYTLFLLDDEVPTLFAHSSKRQSVKALHPPSQSRNNMGSAGSRIPALPEMVGRTSLTQVRGTCERNTHRAPTKPTHTGHPTGVSDAARTWGLTWWDLILMTKNS